MIKKQPILLIAFQIFALLLTSNTWASPKDLLGNLHNMQLLSSSVVANYHLFAGLDADAKYGNRLKKNLSEFKITLAESSDIPTADTVRDEFKQLRIQWEMFNVLVEENYQDMMKQGFPNVRLVADMDMAHRELTKQLSTLYISIEKNSDVRLAPETKLSRNLSLLMQRINTQYAARGSSNLGQVFNGNFEYTLEALGAEFDTDLQQLKKISNRPSDKSLISSINSKWLFISRSIANYNQNSVVFLVSSYSDRIIINLEKIAEIHNP